MKIKKENRGGYRPNSGRKPKLNKEKRVNIQVKESLFLKLKSLKGTLSFGNFIENLLKK